MFRFAVKCMKSLVAAHWNSRIPLLIGQGFCETGGDLRQDFLRKPRVFWFVLINARPKRRGNDRKGEARRGEARRGEERRGQDTSWVEWSCVALRRVASRRIASSGVEWSGAELSWKWKKWKWSWKWMLLISFLDICPCSDYFSTYCISSFII